MRGTSLVGRTMTGTEFMPDGTPQDCVAPVGDAGNRHRRMMLRRWRVFAAIFMVYLGYALPDLWQEHALPGRVFGILLLLGFSALYLGPLPLAAFERRPGWAPSVFAGMCAIPVVYLLTLGGGGIVMATYLSIAFVLLLPVRISVPSVLALVVAVTVLPQYVGSWDLVGLQFGVGVPTLLVAMAMFGLRSGFANTTALYQARQEVERLAAEQERLRIARDLHDLLGHALTTVTLKAELAARLVARDPGRAAAEMIEVAELARQGLADVRATVAGYREMSLLGELAAAREVLAAAGMTAELPAAVEDVSAPARELFGWAVREGITNVVRHSRASRVTVTLRARSVEVADDGVGPATGATAGCGLAGLAERVAAAGGRLTSGPRPGGGYRLLVELDQQRPAVPEIVAPARPLQTIEQAPAGEPVR
jgi:two-component system, NarL family, sensor histidine kinase DesK